VKKPISILIILCFFITSVYGNYPVYAQDFRLPTPGVRVGLSPEYNPAILKGIKVHPDNPFRFDFILDQGDSLTADKKQDATRLIKYFLASLTVPEKDLWVNLSPYEKDRIIPGSFGLTEMGRDLLAEDYMLKQITASLIYPEGETGKKFWKRVYEQAAQKFGTTEIAVNTFNKVWIMPQKAVVYENAKAGTAYVIESKLKVMLDQDYLAFEKNQRQPGDMNPAGYVSPSTLPNELGLNAKATQRKSLNALGSQIIREIVIPELTREVNEDRNFAQLRQVYNSLILATWYKKKIRDSILESVYADKNKVKGLTTNEGDIEAIYQRYLQAFKKGVYNYIKEDVDPLTLTTVPRKYFSGGVDLALSVNGETNLKSDSAMTIVHELTAPIAGDLRGYSVVSTDLAMFSKAGAIARRLLGINTPQPKVMMLSLQRPQGNNPSGFDHPLAGWVQSLSKDQFYFSDTERKQQLERFRKMMNNENLADIDHREEAIRRTVDIVKAVPNMGALPGNYSEADAWQEMTREYQQAAVGLNEPAYANVPVQLKAMLDGNDYKYLPRKLASAVLDHIRLYHYNVGYSIPYTLMSLRPDLSYYRENTDEPSGSKVTKIVYFSRSANSILEITEFYFVDGNYYGYGHAILTSRGLEGNALDNLVLLFHIFKENRGNVWLSGKIFKERMKEFEALLPENGRFEVKQDQFDKVPAALPFYSRMGFKPENQALEGLVGSFIDIGRIDPKKFARLVNDNKYRELFSSSLTLPASEVRNDQAMSAQPNPAMENPEPSPESFNFKDMIEKEVIPQLPQGSDEERRLYAPDRVTVSIPDSVIMQTSPEEESGKFYMDLILREMLLNALNAQQTGKVEVSFKDDVIYFKNEGNLFSRMWDGYHLLLKNHLLWVSHNPADGSIIDFTHQDSLPQPGSYKEGSDRYNTAVKELALYREATEAEINKLFETPEGRTLLFFSRRNISFSGVQGTKGFGIAAINGVSGTLGGKLLLIDDGQKSGKVTFAVKFFKESLITFTDQAMQGTAQKAAELISPLAKSRDASDVANEIRGLLVQNNIALQLEYISDGRDKKPGDDKYTRFYTLLDPLNGRRVIIVSLADGQIEYRYRDAVLTAPHEIPAPTDEGVPAIIERIQQYVRNANRQLKGKVIDTAWVFGSRANGNWARDIDDTDVFLKVSSPEYLNGDVYRQTEVMMHQMLFDKDAGYIPTFDVYLYYNPSNDGTFLESPQSQFYDSEISHKLNIGLMFKVPLEDQAMNAAMSGYLKRLAYHDKDYRRGAVSLLSKELNKENIFEWSSNIIGNFIDPVGISEAQAFFKEQKMKGTFDPVTARRNARWASIFSLKYDVFTLAKGKSELRERFKAWIDQRIKGEIAVWLESNHLNINSPEINTGTKEEIALINAGQLGHEADPLLGQSAFLENIRLIYLAAQMIRRGEIKSFSIEPYVYSAIENLFLGENLSQSEKAVIFPGVDQHEISGIEISQAKGDWDQLKDDLEIYKAVFTDPSAGSYFDALVNDLIAIGNDNKIDLEKARLKVLETNGGFEEGYVDEQGRLIRSNGPTVIKMRQEQKVPPQVKGDQLKRALAAKFDEEYTEALQDGAKANNPAELKRHLVNLLQVALTVKDMARSADQAMASKSSVSVSRGISVETVPNVNDMSYRVARSMADTLLVNNLSGKPTVFICPTGGTQDGIYADFLSIIEEEHIDFTNLHTFNMDEYYVGSRFQGDWGKDPRSYRYYMEHHLFSRLRELNPQWDKDNSRVHFLNGQAPDVWQESERYEEEFQHMRDTVGIDLEIGGIGRNGHIAFNEPVITDNDSLLLDIKKVIDYNEFRITGDRRTWPKTVHGLLFRHWISREEPAITTYLENEFLRTGVVATRENIHLLARKLIWQKVTIYIDGLQPSDVQGLKNGVSDLIRDFHLHEYSVEFRNSDMIFDLRTHPVQLSIPTIIDNSRYFKKLDDIPLTAMTIGLGTVLDAKKIMIAANGPAKQEAVYAAVAEPESAEVSSSSLQRHKNVTFIIDAAAGKLYRDSGAGKRVQAAPLQASDQAMNSVRIADNVDSLDFNDVWRQIQAINQTVSSDYYHPNKESEQLMQDSLKQTDPNFKYALAMDASGTKILGYVFFDTLMRYTKVVYISNLAVLPEYQGKHIGIQLIKHVLEYANQLGHLPVQLNTASSQNPALDFYDQLPANIPGVTMESTGFEGKAYYELTYNPLTQKQIEDQLLQSSRRHFKAEGAKQLWLDLKMDKDRAPGELPAKLQGMTQNEIGQLYHISAGKVSALLVGAGIFRTGRKLKGGIDLTPANMNLQTQNAGGAIKFQLDPAMLAQLQNAAGFVPVIINIQPLADLTRFLGIGSAEIAHT